MRWVEVQAPIDALGVASDESGICRVQFGGVPEGRPVSPPDELLERAADELTRYFAGEAVDFTVPLSVQGGSSFERAVWWQLYTIPYAEMRTYGQIAAAVGEPDAARAVGTACNRNPIPVIIPCHRVVGAGGKLVGFGGGLWRKKHLLELEARVRIEREFGLF
ncbi:methylated-DNA--[protein]-cysteine S-methyltransferase [Dactylosporangium sp. NPDC051485]|uniref:methylated-DNA--[protein]-cysteine S-methyltransferase n=1 Tax=Dactylosporangium sp. NPDC051485 TaxID=3154846 RepID=UPI003431B1EF